MRVAFVLLLSLALPAFALPTAAAEPCLADVPGVCIQDPVCDGQRLVDCLGVCTRFLACPSLDCLQGGFPRCGPPL